MNNIFIYKNDSSRVLSLAESLSENANVKMIDGISLFDLLEYQKPSIVFLNDNTCPKEHVEYAKQDFPETKFVLITETNNDPTEYDLVIHLNDNGQGMFLGYLANQNFYTDNVSEELKQLYKSDILYISDDYSGNQYILDIIKSLSENYTVKVYGKKRLVCNSYLGSCNRSDYKNIIGSTNIMLLFDKKLLNTAMLCKKIPLVYSQTPINEYEFSDYAQLLDVIKNCKPIGDFKLETYKDFCEKMLQELYK